MHICIKESLDVVVWVSSVPIDGHCTLHIRLPQLCPIWLDQHPAACLTIGLSSSGSLANNIVHIMARDVTAAHGATSWSMDFYRNSSEFVHNSQSTRLGIDTKDPEPFSLRKFDLDQVITIVVIGNQLYFYDAHGLLDMQYLPADVVDNCFPVVSAFRTHPCINRAANMAIVNRTPTPVHQMSRYRDALESKLHVVGGSKRSTNQGYADSERDAMPPGAHGDLHEAYQQTISLSTYGMQNLGRTCHFNAACQC